MSQLRKPTLWYRTSVTTTGREVLLPEPAGGDRRVHLYNGSNISVELLLLPDGTREVDFASLKMSAIDAALMDAALRAQDQLLPTLDGGKSLPFPFLVMPQQAILARAVEGIVELSVCVEFLA